MTGWWFGTWLLFFHSVGNVIIPTDFNSIIFQMGRWRKTTNQMRISTGLILILTDSISTDMSQEAREDFPLMRVVNLMVNDLFLWAMASTPL